MHWVLQKAAVDPSHSYPKMHFVPKCRTLQMQRAKQLQYLTAASKDAETPTNRPLAGRIASPSHGSPNMPGPRIYLEPGSGMPGTCLGPGFPWVPRTRPPCTPGAQVNPGPEYYPGLMGPGHPGMYPGPRNKCNRLVTHQNTTTCTRGTAEAVAGPLVQSPKAWPFLAP